MVMNIQNSQDFSFAEQKLQNLQTTTTNIASKFCVKQIIYYESSSFVMLTMQKNWSKLTGNVKRIQ
jgi:hypothetical protein